MNKQTVAVIFGGVSTEHEISCKSAVNVISGMDSNKYETVLVGITKDGRWLLVKSVSSIGDGSWVNGTTKAVISPDTEHKGILIIRTDGSTELISIDVVFPVLHGKNGEDGSIQGLFTLAGIPYVGCGILSSAVTMDKLFTKIIVDRLGIAQAKYVPAFRRELTDVEVVCARVEAALDYPVFVKPSNAGSSCGVNKASNRAELKDALFKAAEVDSKILVEETIIGRELECAVFSAGTPMASGVGEILAADTFYSYDAKYNNPDSDTVINPELPEGKAEEIRRDAIEIFKAVDGFSLSRVDFFLEKGTNRVVFNELNAMPGFTAISMYPALCEAAGLPKAELIDKLIQSAFRR